MFHPDKRVLAVEKAQGEDRDASGVQAGGLGAAGEWWEDGDNIPRPKWLLGSGIPSIDEPDALEIGRDA